MNGILGEIRIFAGNFAPKKWAFCEGQIINISDNNALYAILGTMYGGDGRTNFHLPDLRGRVPYSTNEDRSALPFGIQGTTGGAETHVMTVAEMPPHIHTLQVSKDKLKIPVGSGAASTPDPNGALLTQTSANFYSTTYTALYGALALGLSITLNNTGSAQPFNIVQPSLAVHYIICTDGIFPARN
ncbi:MAG: tail fiber protein [Bacteroidota bacterium]